MEIVVKVQQGKLRGTAAKNLNEEVYYKFLGVPYAKPPTGNLRFQIPHPLDSSWPGVRDATKEKPPCFGINMLTKEMYGSEDCLYLNIYTKRFPGHGGELAPVIFYIPGGGYTGDDSTEKKYGAKYFMTENIVLVRVSYRLGILGFLSLKDASLGVPANNGIKDQVLALRWVQNNIIQFNGNPQNITLMGAGAGAVCVHWHILSPKSTNLFHKAILTSGSILCPWAWGSQCAMEVVQKLGYHSVNTEKEALDILKEATVDELSRVELMMARVVDITKKAPFGLVKEEVSPSCNNNTMDQLMSGNYNKVPMIFGFNSNEGLLYEYLKLLNPGPDIEIDRYPKSFLFQGSSSSLSMREFYLGNKSHPIPVHKVRAQMQKWYSDVFFLCGIILSARITQQTSPHPIYIYEFAAETDLTQKLKDLLPEQFPGVPHGGDLFYLFNTDRLGKLSKADEKVVRNYVGLLSNFAQYGRPTKEGDVISWDPMVANEPVKYLQISEKLTMETNPMKERHKFWGEVLKKHFYIYV